MTLKNHFIMTLPFYQNVKLGTTPTFYYQPPSPPSAHIRLFWFRRKQKTYLGTNYHSLKMSKALLSSFRTAVLLTLFINLVCFLVFLSRALRRCGSPANIFSTLTTTNIYPSIFFSHPPPILRVISRSSSKIILFWPPTPSLWKFRKISTLPAYSTS